VVPAGLTVRANTAGGTQEPKPRPDVRQASASSFVVATAEPAAPIHMLTAAQRRAIVDLFFAGEMTRKRMFYEAEGYKDVPGQTVDVLFRKELVKLSVSTQKDSRGRFIRYRYAIALTREGEWFAHAIMESECRHQSAIETIGAGLRDGAEIAVDEFEDSPNVYGDGEELEVSESI
jgi:hypothetical protein